MPKIITKIARYEGNCNYREGDEIEVTDERLKAFDKNDYELVKAGKEKKEKDEKDSQEELKKNEENKQIKGGSKK